MKTGVGVVLVTGFISAFLAYSLYKSLWQGAFYDLTALAFVCYTYVIYRLSKGKWSLLSFVIFLTTLNSFIDELFFDPTSLCINEYIGFVLTIIITHLFKDKWENSGGS